MKISVEWLQDYVAINEPPTELAEALTMAGLEVEGIEDVNGTTVLEIGVTPNRPDWLCHVGVAREVAAIFHRDLKLPDCSVPEEGPEVEAQTSIEIENPEACSRYSGRVVKGITIGPSPDWVAARLESVGVRSINNVVDATNYVMMELGQPLHAFDYHRLGENRIVVRTARRGEKIVTLDGEQRELLESDLLICDGLGPVALAGVMGGANSEVMDDTADLLLESACFDPTFIRRTSKRMGLSTEASYRFERGTDPSGTARAVDRLARLVVEWSGGAVSRGVYDAHPAPEASRTVAFRVDRINEFLGVSLAEREVLQILSALTLDPEPSPDGGLVINVPGFRRDLTREEDVIEEVGRIYGYQNIPVTMPVGTTVPVKPRRIEVLQTAVRDLMEGMGFSEAITYSFVDMGHLEALGIAGGQDPVRLLNPLSEEMEVMRTSILPGLLKTARTNASRRVEDMAIYEVGRVFLPCTECDLPEERIRLTAVMTGRRHHKSWYGPEATADFYDLKGAVEALLEALGVTDVTLADMEVPYLQPGQSAWVSAGDIPLGPLGTIHPAVREKFRLKGWAGCFELDLNHLERVPVTRKYRPIPPYPGLHRDLAILVPATVSSADLEAVIRETAADLASLNLFDLYQGKGIPQDKKSIAYALVFRSPERTLTDEEVDRSMAGILRVLRKKFGAELR